MTNVLDILKERGFVEAMTSEELYPHLAESRKIYCGFDPTCESLHLGNMIALMGLAWFQRFGHTPVAVIGGATGMIGDPSGKSKERQLLDESTIRKNEEGIKKNLEAILDFRNSSHNAILANNFDWFKNFYLIDFLRDVGKFFRVGPMLAKESVRARLNSEEGISFTEFSYQLLQGYDFLYLSEQYGVTVQIGGSDQWGNITAGNDLIRKVKNRSVFGVTFPLLTTSEGKKFGKTEEGSVWLSPDKLSPYHFYQYLYRTADSDVIKLMRLLTFMEMDEIRDYERRLSSSSYVPNAAQKRLAQEITRIVHGDIGLDTAIRVTDAASPGAQATLDASMLENVASDMPSYELNVTQIIDTKLVDLIIKIGLQNSKGEARRLIRNGGVYLNNEKISDENRTIKESDLIDQRLLLLAVGKKNKILIRIL
jgi:tyrosyl-tRNA synthetase